MKIIITESQIQLLRRLQDIEKYVNYAIKTKYLKLLIDEMTDKVELPKTTFPKTTLLTEKIKILSNYVVWIKIKN